jgi:hypothetical protein
MDARASNVTLESEAARGTDHVRGPARWHLTAHMGQPTRRELALCLGEPLIPFCSLLGRVLLARRRREAAMRSALPFLSAAMVGLEASEVAS